MAETPEICPVCGTGVPERARACPECGADEKTGWSEKARYDALGIPDDDSFDYEDFINREFEGKKPRRRNAWLWAAAALLLLSVFALAFFRNFHR
jgi:predicted nucleic acid-binding Zn ribbon protein